MARYKPVDQHFSKLLPVKFSEQTLPGTFERVARRAGKPIGASRHSRKAGWPAALPPLLKTLFEQFLACLVAKSASLP